MRRAEVVERACFVERVLPRRARLHLARFEQPSGTPALPASPVLAPDVTVWNKVSVLRHVTVPPTLTVTTLGEMAMSALAGSQAAGGMVTSKKVGQG